MIVGMHAADIDAHVDVAYLRQRVDARCAAGDDYFHAHAREIATCASAMADRFFAGATLLVFGSGAAATDAQHNSVEFVHPVLPGCRALPALSLASDAGTVTGILDGADPADVYAHQVRVLGSARDIALAFVSSDNDRAVLRGLEAATAAGMVTLALSAGETRPPSAATHSFHVGVADALIAQELHLATYHMLWELVHIVLNHRGIAGTAP
jgi:D-sedoheptulose 7-phosphate isomerase